MRVHRASRDAHSPRWNACLPDWFPQTAAWMPAKTNRAGMRVRFGQTDRPCKNPQCCRLERRATVFRSCSERPRSLIRKFEPRQLRVSRSRCAAIRTLAARAGMTGRSNARPGHCQAGDTRLRMQPAAPPLLPIPDIDEMAGDRGRCGHGRRDQMGAALEALTALEISVRGGGAALFGF